jgi:hypothetical protein
MASASSFTIIMFLLPRQLPFTESGVVALSPYGIAVRSSKGEYLTYNAATGATVDVTGFTFDFQKMPAAIKDLRAGDMVWQAYVCPVC